MKMNLIESANEEVLDEYVGIPAKEGYYFPAEWEKHAATWLSWPHNKKTWPGKFESIWPAYLEFIRILSLSENVNINVNDIEMARTAHKMISNYGAELKNIYFYINPTNDAWCRDHGPAFLVHKDRSKPKIVIDWEYNAWGGKYPPFDLDNAIPSRIALQLGLKVSKPGIIMEGGSIDVNSNGALLTSEACLLNKNRNPDLTKVEIEEKLRDFYGAETIIWLKNGIIGDDTDGHVDDLTRFVSENTVVTMIEENPNDENYKTLSSNRDLLKSCRVDGNALEVFELPMPSPIVFNGHRLPASYANFYISNAHVIVPIFKSKFDEQALAVLDYLFPNREVLGIDSRELIWGLGSFHCLSQQMPL